MFGTLRFVGYILVVAVVAVVIIKQMRGAICDQCRKRMGKKSVKRSVYGEEQSICFECNERFKANENIPDLNNLNY